MNKSNLKNFLNYKNYDENILKIFIFIIFIFFISANLAWLNPRPDFPAYIFFQKIPLFWQYNKDASTELLSAAYFPDYFIENGIRIERPGIPILVNLITRVLSALIEIFYPVQKIVLAAFSFLTLNLLIFLFSGYFLYKILLRYTDYNSSFYATLIFFSQKYSLIYATSFHTTHLSILTPIIITFLFLDIADKYRLEKNIFYSLAIGVLMMCKPNYAAYFSVLFFSFINKKYKEAFLSFIIHIIPFALYLFFLKLVNIKFYSFSSAQYGQFTKIFENFFNSPFDFFFNIFPQFIFEFSHQLISNFHFWLIVFFSSLYYFFKKNILKKNDLKFIFIFFSFIFLQFFAANGIGTLLPDLSYIIYSISTIGLIIFLKKKNKINYIKTIVSFNLTLILFLGIAKYPWVHPYDQKKHDYSIRKEQLLNKYE